MANSESAKTGPLRNSAIATSPEEKAFAEVVEMIQAARGRALATVNTTIIDLYWRVGEYICRKLETAAWGEGVVDQLASYIQQCQPNIRGFTRANLFRMKQFYETYRCDEKVAPLVRQLPWTHDLLILAQSKDTTLNAIAKKLSVRPKDIATY